MDFLTAVEGRFDARPAAGAGARARDVAQLSRPLTIEAKNARAAPKPDLIPLSDGAGEVVAVGPGVTRVKVGDRVAGCFMQKWLGGAIDETAIASALGGAIDGMLTELAVLDEDGVVSCPRHLSFEEGATLPCAGLTAWHALVEIGNITAGDIVLVQGTGGVSIFALQFARMHGARVIATSSSDAKAGAAEDDGRRSRHRLSRHARLGQGGDEADRRPRRRSRSRSAAPAPCRGRSWPTRLGGRIAVIGLLSGMAELDPMPILRRNLRVQGLYVGTRKCSRP